MKKKSLKIFIWNFLILLVLLIILEAVFTVLQRSGKIDGVSLAWQRDKIYHHVHPKDKCILVKDVEFDPINCCYDKDGLRVADKDLDVTDSTTLWFLGDSFTDAYMLNWDDSFVGIVQRETGFNVTNFGVGSYSPQIHSIILNSNLRVLQKSPPDFVIIQVYSNDLEDDEKYNLTTSYDSLGLPIAADGQANFIVEKLKKSVFAMWLRVKWYSVYSRLNVQKNNLDSLENLFNIQNHEYYDIDENSRFALNIYQIDSILNFNKIEHVFFAIPSKLESKTKTYTDSTFAHNFNRYCIDNKIPYIDLIHTFSNYHKSNELFYKVDAHCTAEGNKIIADGILDWIYHCKDRRQDI